MVIPSSITFLIYVASFLVLYYQYYKRSFTRFDFGIHFWLMAGALALMFAAVFLTEGLFPLVLFGLALLWLVISFYLLYRMLRAD